MSYIHQGQCKVDMEREKPGHGGLDVRVVDDVRHVDVGKNLCSVWRESRSRAAAERGV